MALSAESGTAPSVKLAVNNVAQLLLQTLSLSTPIIILTTLDL